MLSALLWRNGTYIDAWFILKRFKHNYISTKLDWKPIINLSLSLLVKTIQEISALEETYLQVTGSTQLGCSAVVLQSKLLENL